MDVLDHVTVGLSALTNLDQLVLDEHIGGMETINLYEAKTQLSKLVERAAAGEEIIIAKAGLPLARLVPLEASPPKRTLGILKGRSDVWIGEDFDDPLPEDMRREFGIE